MVSLVDIADLHKAVPIRGVDIQVLGVSAEGIAHLLASFPELRKLVGGKGGTLTADDMMTFAPRAVAAAIAAGTGSAADPKAEAAAARLSVGEQLDLLAEIFALTFPQGFGPFVEKLESLMATGVQAVAVVESGKVPDTKSPAPSNA